MPWQRPRDQAGCICNNLRTLTEYLLRNFGRLGILDCPSFSGKDTLHEIKFGFKNVKKGIKTEVLYRSVLKS